MIRSTYARAVMLGVLITLPACSLIGLGGGPPNVAGTYSAVIDIDGQSIPGTFTISQDSGTLAGAFDSPAIGVSAEGPGMIEGEAVTFSLAYALQCPGEADLVGELREDGRIVGTIVAIDCTAQLEGTFEFRPQEGG